MGLLVIIVILLLNSDIFIYFFLNSTELPLEPSLSRTLIEANELGCLSHALTVTAMLSAETSLLPARRSTLLIYIIFRFL